MTALLSPPSNEMRRSRIAQRAPYDVLMVVLATAFGLLGLRPLSDYDVWWHLRTGELIVESGFTDRDPWSAMSSEPWLLHEWASEVLMYLAQDLGGYRGVIALHAAGMFLLASLVLRTVRRVASPGAACAIGAISLIGLFLGSAERPQLVSWCLLAGILPAVIRSVSNRRPPWWLVPVMWAWASLHGLWAAGLVLFGALVLGLIIEVGARSWRVYVPFVSVGLASVIAVMCTPVGPALLVAPLHVRQYAPFIAEWSPPSLLNPFFGAAYLLLAITVTGWARRSVPVPPHTLCLFVAACFLGFAYTRTIPIAVIVLAPMAASAWSSPEREVHRQANPPPGTTRVFGIAALVLLIASVAWLPYVPGVQRGAPWEASRTLDQLGGRANVLNEYEFGGWLLWTARDTSPGIDGRTEIYAPSYVRDYIRTLQLEGKWRGFIRKHRYDAAWLRTSTPLVYGLTSIGWTPIFRDDFTVILLPPKNGA
jgi:hypothetical protein